MIKPHNQTFKDLDALIKQALPERTKQILQATYLLNNNQLHLAEYKLKQPLGERK